MYRIALGIMVSGLHLWVAEAAPSERENPRPVERPSRAVEELMKRREAGKDGVRQAEKEGAKSAPAEAVGLAETNEEKGKGKPGASVFQVAGAEVWEVARQAGWKFFPRGARGALDGMNTVAEIPPGLPLSLVQGLVMTQRRTPAGWGAISQNTFYLFMDGSGRAKSLAPGWAIRDLRLSGDPFRWVSRPEAGGTSPSLAIQIAGGRNARDSVVRMEGLVLEGPANAKDWRVAFAGR